MRLFCLLFLLLLCFVGFSQSQLASVDTLTKHVYYLASEELEGRATGQQGQKKAAAYIARQFEQYGLQPYSKKDYYHYYDLKRLHKNKLVVTSNGSKLFWPWHFYYVSGYNHTDSIDTELVFVGYGSQKELEPLNIYGKAIALIAESPSEAYAVIKQISKNHKNHTFFVIFPKRNTDVGHNWGTHLQMSEYNLPNTFDNRKLQLVQEEWAKNSDSLNIFYCFPNVLRNFFMLEDKELERIAINNNIENNGALATVIKPKLSCYISCNDSVESINVENVAGRILGKDTSKTIVVSAHYDHIGVEGGKINYGADDNASGTAALLENARLMALDAKQGRKPEVNVLFIAFSGEEIGLLGSKAYVQDSGVNLSRIKLNINMDMLGRWDDKHKNKKDFVYLLAQGAISKSLYKIGKRQIEIPNGFTLSTKPASFEKELFKSGSDHYSFFKKDIPAVVFFTGLHDDYHTPYDTPDKINYKNLTNISNVVYQYIYKAAEIE